MHAAGVTPAVVMVGCKEAWQVPVRDRSHALDHIVVVLFENRSFDNVLGHLYGPGDGKNFDGVVGKDLSNPIPWWAEHGADRKVVPYTVATDMDSPNRRPLLPTPNSQAAVIARAQSAVRKPRTSLIGASRAASGGRATNNSAQCAPSCSSGAGSSPRARKLARAACRSSSLANRRWGTQ